MNPTPHNQDGELLAAFVRGDRDAAFTELVRRHGTMVYGIAWRVLGNHHEAQDVSQAVFVTLARKAGGLRRDKSLTGWLHHVTICTARDARTRQHRRQQREDRAMQEAPTVEPSAIDQRQFREELDAAIDQLPDRYRRPLAEFHLQGKSLQETAQILGLTVTATTVRLVRARELLRKKLVRRGVTVGSVGALTALLSAESGAAVLPPTFVASTVSAATGGAVSTTVAALSKGALHMLFIAKVKTVSLAAAACLVVAGTGIVAAKQLAGSSTPAPFETKVAVPVATPVLVAAAPAQPPAVPPAPVAPKAAEQPLRFTAADNGKSVTVAVGQVIEILLLNGREGAGWEGSASEITGQSVERADKMRSANCDSFTAEKAPTPDTTIGMYVFRYRAMKTGTSVISLLHCYPGGPIIPARQKTSRLGEFKLIVEVTADGAAAVPAVNEYQAQQTAQLWVNGLLAGRVDQILAVSDVPFGWDKVVVVKTDEELKAKLEAVVQNKGARNLVAGEAIVLKDKAAAQATQWFTQMETSNLTFVTVVVETAEGKKAGITVAIKPGNQLKVVGFAD